MLKPHYIWCTVHLYHFQVWYFKVHKFVKKYVNFAKIYLLFLSVNIQKLNTIMDLLDAVALVQTSRFLVWFLFKKGVIFTMVVFFFCPRKGKAWPFWTNHCLYLKKLKSSFSLYAHTIYMCVCVKVKVLWNIYDTICLELGKTVPNCSCFKYAKRSFSNSLETSFRWDIILLNITWI